MGNVASYVLVTPARNEAEFIESTIQSVIGQTLLPLKWVIVSDGSTDGTEEIVARYMVSHPWIELVRMPDRSERHFAGKVHAFNAGYERVKGLKADVVTNLDADVSFDGNYCQFLLEKFAENPKLGVAGTAFREGGLSYNYEFVGLEHVSGMCQMFRSECFEAINGYSAVKSGGIDLIAVLSARAKGWETRTFVEKLFVHHRIQGGALHSGLRGRFNTGRKDYLIGNHPLWEIFRSAYQMTRKPYFVGGVTVLVSYFWTSFRGVKRTMPEELITIRRNDQMRRLKAVLGRRFNLVGDSL
jgi:poly-beta-1,6-N-acetyl-D-glucosamine synthase